MKLLQRLRSMSPGGEAPADPSPLETLPSFDRDDPHPRAGEPFEPVPGTRGTPCHAEPARH